MIPLEELEEAGLCARGSFDAPETQVISSALKVAQVHDQILQPEARSLPDCSQLSRSEKKKREDKPNIY